MLCISQFIPSAETQVGASAFAFVALLLLALPVEFTFHVLFELPRLAERRRTF
jgi:hypothetical protein